MTPDTTVVSKHGFVSLVTSDIDVALASGRGGLPINRVVAAFFRARCRCDLLRQHIIAVEIIENYQHCRGSPTSPRDRTVYHAGLTSLGIIVDRCETPYHIRRMFVAISKIGAVALSAHHNSRMIHCGLHMWKTNGMCC